MGNRSKRDPMRGWGGGGGRTVRSGKQEQKRSDEGLRRPAYD